MGLFFFFPGGSLAGGGEGRWLRSQGLGPALPDPCATCVPLACFPDHCSPLSKSPVQNRRQPVCELGMSRGPWGRGGGRRAEGGEVLRHQGRRDLQKCPDPWDEARW